MKRFFAVVLTGFLLGVLCLAWGWQQWTGPGPTSSGGSASTQVRIPQGMTLSAAADTLVSQGLLGNRRVMLVGARLAGQERGVRAGLYELAYGQSARDLLADLTAGLSVQVVLTIPEGLDSREIATIVQDALGFDTEQFLAVADSLAEPLALHHNLFGTAQGHSVYDSLLVRASSTRIFHWSEGLLAPDTYHFSEGSSPQMVAAMLLDTQVDRLQQAVGRAEVGNNAHLTPWQLLTLASVVETEARRDDERTQIAAVYSNRLQRNWRLEADPTVAFVLGKKGKRLFYKDLKVNSPFNTYRNKGLPPGPIGTPGLASLLATAQPDAQCRAMYFVSDGKDGHVFSRTIGEHEAAVARFRTARSQERRNQR